jgi:hypothetical protein
MDYDIPFLSSQQFMWLYYMNTNKIIKLKKNVENIYFDRFCQFLKQIINYKTKSVTVYHISCGFSECGNLKVVSFSLSYSRNVASECD